MTETLSPLTFSSDPAQPKRRIHDAEPAAPLAKDASDDPEALYSELRAGSRSIESLAAFIPLNVVFAWHAQRKISEVEFAALMADLEIQQVEIRDIPQHKTNEPDAAQQRSDAVIAAFKSRMSNFELKAEQDVISEDDLKPVFLAATPLLDGIGIAMSFIKSEEGKPVKATTPPALTVLCRAFIASKSMQSTVKCEAVFSAGGMARELYCRIVLPLPLHKGGRRRLLVSVLDNDTRQPVNLPPEIAELFHEKNLYGLQVLRKPAPASGGIGSAVIDAFGKMFKK